MNIMTHLCLTLIDTGLGFRERGHEELIAYRYKGSIHYSKHTLQMTVNPFTYPVKLIQRVALKEKVRLSKIPGRLLDNYPPRLDIRFIDPDFLPFFAFVFV
jgi:hypothetical protein